MNLSVELHAIAQDWKENPISTWHIKGVHNGFDYGTATMHNREIKLNILSSDVNDSFTSISQALKFATSYLNENRIVN